ncbi:hypothetical protein [Chitinophaga qingshengii]|uniref:Tetratricopeptide repeat protein n=1 Tax=Chitinophaga qingshengii TaxID=1569794 RepID=A0ABR7TKV4_9BACT|nr:hypothetical protein [Chitinophaga qingshengii]MBC9930161.1 hypothetical protein [Chitinophaga qingshengii]
MDIINPENQFKKALRLLDIGRTEEASGILHDIITHIDQEQHPLLFIRASCALGELLFINGETAAARKHLLNVMHTLPDDDIADYEKSVATDILHQIADRDSRDHI